MFESSDLVVAIYDLYDPIGTFVSTCYFDRQAYILIHDLMWRMHLRFHGEAGSSPFLHPTNHKRVCPCGGTADETLQVWGIFHCNIAQWR